MSSQVKQIDKAPNHNKVISMHFSNSKDLTKNKHIWQQVARKNFLLWGRNLKAEPDSSGRPSASTSMTASHNLMSRNTNCRFNMCVSLEHRLKHKQNCEFSWLHRLPRVKAECWWKTILAPWFWTFLVRTRYTLYFYSRQGKENLFFKACSYPVLNPAISSIYLKLIKADNEANLVFTLFFSGYTRRQWLNKQDTSA